MESQVTSDELKFKQRLTDDETRRLEAATCLSSFERRKLEREAKKNWNLFYKRNGDKFFKNRYWTRQEFGELFLTNDDDTTTKYLLEVGCGCGDFILPLLELDSCPSHSEQLASKTLPDNLFIYCCDISDKAIEILKAKQVYLKHHPARIEAFVSNVVEDGETMQANLAGHLMDYVSLVFVLSTLEPDTMKSAIENIHRVMKAGGLVLFRDYALYDKAMLRFGEKSKICDQFYVRQDGTRAYFFTKHQLIGLFGCGDKRLFELQSIDYVERETVNMASGDKHSRIFLQAKFTCRK